MYREHDIEHFELQWHIYEHTYRRTKVFLENQQLDKVQQTRNQTCHYLVRDQDNQTGTVLCWTFMCIKTAQLFFL